MQSCLFEANSCEGFHKTVLDKFYRVAFRKKLYASIEDLQNDLDLWIKSYNEDRPHQGRWCFGKTPLQTGRASAFLYRPAKTLKRHRNFSVPMAMPRVAFPLRDHDCVVFPRTARALALRTEPLRLPGIEVPA